MLLLESLDGPCEVGQPLTLVAFDAGDTGRMMVELHNNLCIKGLPIPNEVARSIINGLIGVLEEASLNRLCPMVDD